MEEGKETVIKERREEGKREEKEIKGDGYETEWWQEMEEGREEKIKRERKKY